MTSAATKRITQQNLIQEKHMSGMRRGDVVLALTEQPPDVPCCPRGHHPIPQRKRRFRWWAARRPLAEPLPGSIFLPTKSLSSVSPPSFLRQRTAASETPSGGLQNNHVGACCHVQLSRSWCEVDVMMALAGRACEWSLVYLASAA